MNGMCKTRLEKRRELAAKLPDLAKRIFRLDPSYSMLKSIGHLLNSVNDYDSRYELHTELINEIVYETLLEDVVNEEEAFYSDNT
jgi:hypothetical protein